jgi:DNA polymerase III delta prime subunit
MQPWLSAAWREIQRGGAHGRPQAFCVVHPPGVAVVELRERLTSVLLCQAVDAPCGQCPSCHQLQLGTHPDVLMLLPEGAAGMIPVDAVRNAIQTAYMTAALGGKRVIQVRPAEALNQSSSNALLKIVEEPPAGTFFIFETALPGKMLPTLVSRLRMIRVAPPEIETMAQFAKASGVSEDAVQLGDVLLAAPLVGLDAPERLELAKSVLKALHQVNSGDDPQRVATQFQKKDPTIVLTTFSRILMAVIRARTGGQSVLGFQGPYPDTHWLMQVLDRVNESRHQAQSNIAVNLPLTMSVLLAAWSFIWTRVQS